MSRRATKRGDATGDDGWLYRERAIALALMVATGIVFYLCYRLLLPFLPALAWALALAVIAHPVHRAIAGWLPYSNLAAALSVGVVIFVILVPAIFVTHNLVREAANYTQAAQDEFSSGQWRAAVERNPRLKQMLQWFESRLGIQDKEEKKAGGEGGEGEPANEERGEAPPPTGSPAPLPKGVAPVEGAANLLSRGFAPMLTGTVWLVMQLFITVLALFFFFRDQHKALGVLRSLMPLSNSETDEVFERVDDTIHATIFGSLVVALVQGTMGGLMFWWLGLPAPLMWGAVMALLAVVPMLGTFVVWAPTAIYLAMRGDWTSALLLAGWGGVAIALIDNLLYPYLVGKRLRFHTLLVFFAIMGGLALFGASGIILGPLLLAVADALLHVWKGRTAHGHTIDGSVDAGS